MTRGEILNKHLPKGTAWTIEVERGVQWAMEEYASYKIADSIMDLKVGDKIDIGGFITTLEEIKYDHYARINLYWFYNEKGEYKYNVREWITKV